MDIIILSIGFRPNMGGLETHLTDLTNELKKKLSLLVVTLTPITTEVKGKLVEKQKNLTIWRIPWIGRGLFYKLQKQPLLEFFYLMPPMFFGLFIALVVHPEVKVIHAQGLTGAIPGGILGKLFGKRVVVSTHFVYNFKDNFFAKFTKWAYNLADRILCVSLKSGEEMREVGIPQEKIGRCAYWIDLNQFRPVDKTKAKKAVGWPNDFSVLFVGRLVKEKGILELVLSLREMDKNIHLYIVGDGPLKEKVLKMGKGFKNFAHLGIVENTKMPLFYSAADVVIVPSYEETLGRVGMEALACSTPVVATDSGGIREVVSEDVGILIDLKPKNIANALNKLYRDKKLYLSMKKNARKYVSKSYSPKNVGVFIKEYGF